MKGLFALKRPLRPQMFKETKKGNKALRISFLKIFTKN